MYLLVFERAFFFAICNFYIDQKEEGIISHHINHTFADFAGRKKNDFLAA